MCSHFFVPTPSHLAHPHVPPSILLASFLIHVHSLASLFFFPPPCFERVKTAKCTAAGNNEQRERERKREMEFSTTLRYQSNGLSIDSNDRRFNCVLLSLSLLLSFLGRQFLPSFFFFPFHRHRVARSRNLHRSNRSLRALSDVIGELNRAFGWEKNPRRRVFYTVGNGGGEDPEFPPVFERRVFNILR